MYLSPLGNAVIWFPHCSISSLENHSFCGQEGAHSRWYHSFCDLLEARKSLLLRPQEGAHSRRYHSFCDLLGGSKIASSAASRGSAQPPISLVLWPSRRLENHFFCGLRGLRTAVVILHSFCGLLRLENHSFYRYCRIPDRKSHAPGVSKCLFLGALDTRFP